MQRGKFIVIEGLDGSGKGTQIERLSEVLWALGIPVITTAEPTDGYIGKHLREMLRDSDNKDMSLQASLFLADRLDHLTNPETGIYACLDNRITVICDRYYYSSFAYQGTAADMDWVMDMNLNSPSMLKPDLCIFFDVEPETCRERITQTRENPELYEKDVGVMRSIRDNFHTVFERLKDSDNIKIIDANRDVDSISNDVLQIVLDVLNS